ncbi:MAG TPA: hypothetical protein VN740_05210, partial [Solirubrobacteraceae bacterium]|nr:hypothetical protein [Solirubrobacteraceae bacterium]
MDEQRHSPPPPRVLESSTSSDGGQPAHKRKTHMPMRDDRGWQVAPAPDGRGAPPSKQPPVHRTRAFMWFVLALLAVDWLTVLLSQGASQPRVNVQFSPYFIQQVTDNRVASITTKGDAVQGTFKYKVVHPPGTTNKTPTKLFSTQVPAFWPGNQLEALLTAHHVQIDAQSTTASTSVLAEILLGFGPTLLIVGLFVLLA